MQNVKLSDGRVVTDFKSGNLKGTRRTLDVTFGGVKLGDGIISRNGVALVDDSASLTLLSDGTVEPRPQAEKDIYVFAYGFNYTSALRDFYRITGETPLIPRFCLGNWWSRFWRYTQDEYLDLMNKFEKNQSAKWSAASLTKMALVTALYVTVTLVFSVISFGAIQFRVCAEQ